MTPNDFITKWRASELKERSELGAATVHAIEDIHDDIKSLVVAGDFVDMQIDIGNPNQGEESPEIAAWVSEIPGNPTDAFRAVLHKFTDVHPQRIVLHFSLAGRTRMSLPPDETEAP